MSEINLLPSKRMELFRVHFFAKISAKISAMQAEGLDVIKLDEGAPDLPPPSFIIDALNNSARHSTSHSYQPHRGIGELRQAWSSMYDRLYGVNLDPNQEVLPLIGSKEGVFHFPMVMIDPGDIVLIPDPGYITYTRGAVLAGGEPYYMPLLPENNYLPDLSAIPQEVLKKAKIMWLNYPNNPTSACASLDFFEQVVEFGKINQILVCHDAAYSQIAFDKFPAPSIFQIKGAKEAVIEFNTLSKSHNMAGWRVGVALGNREAIRLLYTLKTNVDSGHFQPIMEAATMAMNGDQTWIKERNEIYCQRRDIIIQSLNNVGLFPEIPSGSLYVWSPIFPGWTSEDFATFLLDEAEVSVTPGTVFGQYGEGFIRISMTASNKSIGEAMERMEKALIRMKERRIQ